MPEGHTIHKIARDHSKLLTKRPVAVSSPQGRFSADAERVDGAVLERIEPHGKHLFYHWSTGEIGHVHLGLFGKFRVHTGDERPEPRGAVRMRMASDAATIDLAGPTACTIDDPSVRRGILAASAPTRSSPGRTHSGCTTRSPSRRAGSVTCSWTSRSSPASATCIAPRRCYVCGIHPLRPGKECDIAELEALWATITGMLRQGVKDGRILTVRARSRASLVASGSRAARRRSPTSGIRACAAAPRSNASTSRTAPATTARRVSPR